MNNNESSIRISRHAEQSIVTLQGTFDQELASNLVPLIAKLTPPVIFDLKQVSYLTAAGSRVLLGYYQNFGIKPLLRNANTNILDLLALTGCINYVTLLTDDLNRGED